MYLRSSIRNLKDMLVGVGPRWHDPATSASQFRAPIESARDRTACMLTLVTTVSPPPPVRVTALIFESTRYVVMVKRSARLKRQLDLRSDGPTVYPMTSISRSLPRSLRLKVPKSSVPTATSGPSRTPDYRLPPETVLLYADRGMVVINKPRGLISQLADPQNKRMVRAL